MVMSSSELPADRELLTAGFVLLALCRDPVVLAAVEDCRVDEEDDAGRGGDGDQHAEDEQSDVTHLCR